MRRIIRGPRGFGTNFGAMLTAVALVVAMGGAATGSAFAQDRDHGERGRSEVRGHEQHHERVHHRRNVHSTYGYDAPSYGYGGYAPPPVVYAPPEPSGGINLIFPFHIR